MYTLHCTLTYDFMANRPISLSKNRNRLKGGIKSNVHVSLHMWLFPRLGNSDFDCQPNEVQCIFVSGVKSWYIGI